MPSLRQVCDWLGCVVLNDGAGLDREVKQVGAADLMSDVLALSRPGFLLITGQTNPQVIRTAVVAEACAVVLVRGKKASPEVVELARQVNMPLLATPMLMFEVCGRLFEKGLKPC